MAFRADLPPNCRLFILAGKGIDEAAFREAFGKYGTIDDLWIVKDRRTWEDKGVLYITFTKSSEAALAMEEMNGRVVKGNPKPIKVMIASSKRDGSIRDPKEDERYLRLFVVIPKTFKEDDLRREFEDFGDIESVHVLKDKQTGDPKGLGYVKFHRPYHAALAMEQCDKSFKPKFAEPQKTQADRDPDEEYHYNRPPMDRNPGRYPYGDRDVDRGRDFRGPARKRGYPEFDDMPLPRRSRGEREDFLADDGRSRYSTGGGPPPFSGSAYSSPPSSSYGDGPMDMIQAQSHRGCQRLHVTAPLGLTQSYMTKLFNVIPGLEYCDLNEQTGVAYVRYSTPQCAAYAREKLDMFEYPIGSKLIVRFAEGPRQPDIHGATNMGFEGGYHPPSLLDLGDRVGEASAIQQAALVLEKAGLNPDKILVQPNNVETERVTYCNIPLPFPKPLRPEDCPVAQRLFIVCQPSSVSERILRDAFCRFGNLIDVYLLSGRNYGYAKFASKENAMQALTTLHGQNIAGQRLKVLEAEPMRDEGANKRMRQGD